MQKFHLTSQFVSKSKDAFPALVKNTDISVLVLDYEMPEFNGVELLVKVKESFPNRDFIVLGCTGSREGAQRLLEAGADEVFQKPLDSDLLYLKLKKIIFNHHTHRYQQEMLLGFTEIIEKVSLEARNPLYVLYTLLDKVLDQYRMAANYQEMLGMGELAFEKLNHLLEDLQMFVQLHVHQSSVALKETSLDALIASQLFLESSQAQLKNIIINKELESGVLANCDKSKIESVVGRLTNRTLKFAKTGAELNVRLYREDDRIVFEIEDSSTNLDLETVANFLNSNKKVEDLVKNEIELGLVNSKAIVKQHGGEIGVRQGEDGNVFYFSIPENLTMKKKH